MQEEWWYKVTAQPHRQVFREALSGSTCSRITFRRDETIEFIYLDESPCVAHIERRSDSGVTLSAAGRYGATGSARASTADIEVAMRLPY